MGDINTQKSENQKIETIRINSKTIRSELTEMYDNLCDQLKLWKK